MGLPRQEGDDYFAWDRGRQAAQRDRDRNKKSAERSGAASGALIGSLIPYVMMTWYGFIVAALLFWTAISLGLIDPLQVNSFSRWLSQQLSILRKIYISPELVVSLVPIIPFAFLARWGLRTATQNLLKAFLVTIPAPAALCYFNWSTITVDENTGIWVGGFVVAGLGIYTSWLIAFRT